MRRLSLAAEIALAYARTRWALRRGGLDPALERLRGRRALREPVEAEAEAIRLGWVVSRALDRLPGDSACLTRSLVLTTLLARRDIGSSLVIGFRSSEAFAAHAWVEVAGVSLLPSGGGDYERLAQL